MIDLENHVAVDFWPLARRVKAQLRQAFGVQSFRFKFAGLSALLRANPDPQSVYEAYRNSVMFDVVLSNLGKFTISNQATSLRVTALYLLLNAELEPGIARATADGRIGVART
jgi:hypothetical protein